MVSFGGGSQSSESSYRSDAYSTSNPVQVPLWNKEQQELFKKQLYPFLKAGMSDTVPIYPGNMYVPRTEEEQVAFGRYPELANALAEVRAGLGRPAYEVSPEITEQYYQNTIRQPAMKEWEETILPGIKESFAGPGYWGSARAEAERKASEDLATSLSSKRAELYYADEMARRKSLEDAATREAQLAGQYAAGEANLLGTAAQYSRQVDQEKVLSDLQRWLMGEEMQGVKPTMYNPFVQLIFQALGLTPIGIGQASESSATSKGSSTSSGSQFNFGFKW